MMVLVMLLLQVSIVNNSWISITILLLSASLNWKSNIKWVVLTFILFFFVSFCLFFVLNIVCSRSDLSADAVEAHLVALVSTVSAELHAAGCIEITDPSVDLTSLGPAGSNAGSVASQLAQNRAFSCTYLGRIASLYYLNYKTVGLVRARLFDIDDEDFAATAAVAGKLLLFWLPDSAFCTMDLFICFICWLT